MELWKEHVLLDIGIKMTTEEIVEKWARTIMVKSNLRPTMSIKD